MGIFPQVGVKIKNIWNHHLAKFEDDSPWSNEKSDSVKKDLTSKGEVFGRDMGPLISGKSRLVLASIKGPTAVYYGSFMSR